MSNWCYSVKKRGYCNHYFPHCDDSHHLTIGIGSTPEPALTISFISLYLQPTNTMKLTKKIAVFISLLFLAASTPAQSIKQVTAVRASAFERARITLLSDSIFTAWVSVKSNAYDGYINHVVCTSQLPPDSMQMLAVNELRVLNHTNLKKLKFAEGTSFFFQKLPGCIANCYFLKRALLENEKVLLTSFMTDDLPALRNASKIKIPYTVFLVFKTSGNNDKVEQVTYIPKMFTNKSKNKLSRLFKHEPALKAKIENETYSNNIDGLLQLLDDYGKGK